MTYNSNNNMLYGTGDNSCYSGRCGADNNSGKSVPEQLLEYSAMNKDRSYPNTTANISNETLKSMTLPDNYNQPYNPNTDSFLQTPYYYYNMDLSSPQSALQNTVPQPAANTSPNLAAQQGTVLASQSPTNTSKYPLTADSMQYMNGFLRTQIGKKIDVDFLIGTNNIINKSGYLMGIGSNFIIINEENSHNIIIGDFYNAKFIRIYYDDSEDTNQ